jgi:gp48|nr:MAG TPA: hypothetical protein [Ackermannviridae sp.]
MISAKEAYDLSAPNLDKYRKFIEERIRKAISAHKMEVQIREDPYSMWLYDESKLSEKDMDGFRVIQELRNLGYELSQYYSDGSQFVDVALVISWKKIK